VAVAWRANQQVNARGDQGGRVQRQGAGAVGMALAGLPLPLKFCASQESEGTHLGANSR